MTASQELIASVREAAEGTPYVVEERPYGFDVTINIVDKQWYTLLRKNGVKRVFTHEVTLDEGARRLSITDVAQTVRWDGGAGIGSLPSLHAERSFQKGRVYQYSMQKQIGVDAETGQLGMPVDYTFSSGEGRALIRDAARGAGWSERMGGEQKGALVFAGAIVATGIIVGVVFLVKALLG
jgi:hypothetical protein